MKKVARYYYEELNYQVSVKGKVRFCDVDVLVSFEIVSPPPAALVLINFFNEIMIPSLVVKQMETGMVVTRKADETTELLEMMPRIPVNIKLAYENTLKGPFTVNPAMFSGEFNPNYSSLNEVYPLKNSEAVLCNMAEEVSKPFINNILMTMAIGYQVQDLVGSSAWNLIHPESK
ncbi:hypothetical protein ABG067_007041 [Albugo candida]